MPDPAGHGIDGKPTRPASPTRTATTNQAGTWTVVALAGPPVQKLWNVRRCARNPRTTPDGGVNRYVTVVDVVPPPD